jgi:DNA-binding transcriptional LysR family regulator
MNAMNWDDLRYILAMQRARTLQAAAKTLSVSHTTVNRRLSEIEERLGVKLFERSGSGYLPTAAADDICSAAQDIEGMVDDLQRRIEGQDEQLAGVIRVTTTDTLLHGVLADCFASFRRAQPEIALDVVVSNAFFNLNRRESDIAIRPSSEPPENLVGRRLGTLNSAIYGERSYLAARPFGDDWNRYDWVAPSDAMAHLNQHRWVQHHVDPARVALRVDSLLGMKDVVQAGVGVGPLMCLLAEAEPTLVPLGPPLAELATEVWMLTHRDLRRTPRIRAFMDHLSTSLDIR